MNTEPIEFSLHNYRTLVQLVETHIVVRGRKEQIPQRILCINGPDSECPVIAVGLVPNYEPLDFCTNGQHSPKKASDEMDLFIIPKPPKTLGWVGVYKNGNTLFETNLYPTRAGLLTINLPLLAIHEFKEGDGIDV